ncbi:hypothetical protein TRAPUB_12832 [Trametes pubescens]|uniref:F-box domain-containing protein n=1 Tax=Trametes pubescens TaxID=154538 RepID=A0A1M2VSV4_TRAPU|nr:hypothetical protein TRAPUB_12832 [Trametes pubescens]
MAQTRVLHEPAVQMIWHELPTLVHLFKCFPENTWSLEDEGFLVFTRTLAPKDWTAFLKYASFVRQLGTEWCSCPWDVSETAWTAMCSLRPIHILFPHLRSIIWGNQALLADSKQVPSLLTNVGTSLVKIDFGEHAPWDDCEGTLQASFDIIAERFPALRELNFGQNPGSGGPCGIPQIVNAFSTMACRFTSLVSFSSLNLSITPTAILSLLRLKTLRRLHVCLPDHITPQSEHPSPCDDAPLLAQVIEVELHYSTIQAYLAFCQAVALPHTVMLLLSLKHDIQSHLMPNIFSSIRTQCSPDSLTTIDVHDSYDGSNSEGLILPTHLRVLLEFKRLEHFSLDLSCRYALDDSLCADMAMAWPGLRYLHIGCAFSRHHHEALPSVRALTPFAIHCPKLEHLGLVLDATRWENEYAYNADYTQAEIYGALADRASTSAVLSFCPGSSPIRGFRYMAAFLTRVFPNLKKLDHSRRMRIDGIWRQGWSEVERLLPLFKLARQDERLRMTQELAEGPMDSQTASIGD